MGQVVRQAIQAPIGQALSLSPHQWKTMRALAACRTSALGGQLFGCTQCGREHFVAHSCRNRHCPQCQGPQAVDWLQRQESALLPVPYFHLVFTVPHSLNALVRQNRTPLFGLLFRAASQTLLEFGRRRFEAQIGFTAVLHTWSQNLLDHYHLHCIVTGGGVALNQEHWVDSSAHYLFPVRALSRMFQGKFLDGLQQLYEQGKLEFHGHLENLALPNSFTALLKASAKPKWVVYAKRPFAGPKQVLAYLSRYTHRVAISNRRLIAADEQNVTFSYKDYADGARRKMMTLAVSEFVRRIALHILPSRFVKIRHYGLLGNRQREQRLARARELLGVEFTPVSEEQSSQIAPANSEAQAGYCPFCHSPALILLRELSPRQAIKACGLLDSS